MYCRNNILQLNPAKITFTVWQPYVSCRNLLALAWLAALSDHPILACRAVNCRSWVLDTLPYIPVWCGCFPLIHYLRVLLTWHVCSLLMCYGQIIFLVQKNKLQIIGGLIPYNGYFQTRNVMIFWHHPSPLWLQYRAYPSSLSRIM